MPLRNTQDRFGLVAKTFHWLTLLMLIGSFTLAFSMTAMPLSPRKLQFYSWHKWIGVTIFLIVILRLAWRLANPVPQQPATMPLWRRRAAALSHAALYTVLIVMPLTGWIMSSARNLPLVYLGLIYVPSPFGVDRALGETMLHVHHLLAWALLVLVSIHVLAALYHHVILRDDVLWRMLPWRVSLVAAVAAVAVAAGPRLASAADAPAWTVDPAKSSITFTGKQMGAPSHGRFKTFSADIRFDPSAPEASSVTVTIDTASADAGNPDIDKELKREKWFDVGRFPKARFVTTAIRAKDGKVYEAAAKLTIRDVTRDVVLPFTLDIGPDPADPGQLLARASGEMTVSRLAFGIGRDEWKDTSIVADAIAIRIDVVARRKK